MRRKNNDVNFKFLSNKIKTISFLKEKMRMDGRTLVQGRKANIIDLSHDGTSIFDVSFGKTRCIAAVKLDIGEPYPDSPSKGNLITTFIYSLSSTPEVVTGPPCKESILNSRIIDRTIREASDLDFEKLCIKKGSQVWSLFVDIYCISEDGNEVDVGNFAASLALKKFYLQRSEKEFDSKNPQMSVQNSFTFTWAKIDDSLLYDPNREETDTADSIFTFSLNSDGDSGASQLTAPSFPAIFTPKDLKYIWKNSKKIYIDLKKIYDKY